MANLEMNRPELSKAYEPHAVERKWYAFWMEKGYFTPEIDPGKKPFVIIQPPPNITGDLHLGHALTATLEDIMVRWHRMLGEPTLWLPGEDHAGIAAQVVVERMLAKEGLTRQQLGREALVREPVNFRPHRFGISPGLGSTCTPIPRSFLALGLSLPLRCRQSVIGEHPF